MNIGKRILALLLAGSVLSGAGALAAGTTGTAQEPVVLEKVFQDPAAPWAPYVQPLVVLKETQALKAKDLPEEVAYGDAAGKSHPVEVKWDIYDRDLKAPGFHQVTGKPVLEKTMSLKEGFDGAVTYPIFRMGEDATVKAKPLQTPVLTDALITADSKEPLKELAFTTTGLRYGVGETGFLLTDDTWKWDWDLSKVDTAVTGKATVTATLKEYPQWVTVLAADRTSEHTVYVMPGDSIQLYAPVALSEEGELTFQWIYDSAKVSKAVLQVQKEGKWTDCETCWYTYQAPVQADEEKKTEAKPAALLLDLLSIPAGETYSFRLSYVDEVDGKTETRTTEPMTITIPKDIKTLVEKAEGKIPPELKINETAAPEVKPDPDQPDPDQPDPEEKPGIEAAIPADYVTDTYTTLSGQSLSKKIAAGSTVVFEKKGVSLTIPSKLLADLKVADSDLFTVSLTQPKKGSVQITVNAAGKVVTNLTGSTVKMAYTLNKNQTLTCKDFTGKLSPKVTYDTKTATVSFPISQAGTYTLTAKTTSTSTTTNKNTSTNKNTTTNKNTSTNKNTTTATNKNSVTTRPSGSLVSGGSQSNVYRGESTINNDDRDFDEILAEINAMSDEDFGDYTEGPGREEGDEGLYLTEGAEEDAPRTLWDEQTPTALALILVSGMLVAAGVLLRKWRGE